MSAGVCASAVTQVFAVAGASALALGVAGQPFSFWVGRLGQSWAQVHWPFCGGVLITCWAVAHAGAVNVTLGPLAHGNAARFQAL